MKLNQKRLAVLVELAKGRKLVNRPSGGKMWAKGRGPSVANDIIAPMFQSNWIQPDYIAGAMHTNSNFLGSYSITATGRLMMRINSNECHASRGHKSLGIVDAKD